MRFLSIAAVTFAGLCSASAQDLVAVSWSGQVHVLSTASGALTPLAAGPFGQNALARDDSGALWSTARLANTQFWLTRIDPVAGTVDYVHPSIDLRGLASGGAHSLLGIETVQAGESRLWRIDTLTGVHTLAGRTGMNAIQSLGWQGGALWGWQWVRGLVAIDPATGAATDPFAATADNLLIQWFASHPAHGLIGGTSTMLYHIDTSDGTATAIAPLPAGADLRGAEFTGFALPYGQGCDLGQGRITLGARGSLRPGSLLTLASQQHAPSSLRAVIVGFDREQYGTWSLPLLLDPLFGSHGCHLYTSIDFFQFHLAAGNPPTTLTVPVGLPSGSQVLDLFVQVVDLHQPQLPPGTSNGLMLHIVP
ncbi:MAG: hypothetical protein IPK26_00610 [Planctomycetes bacterium]|nr:hypothetical protein [Planctomycetota bacterium]